MSQFAHIRFRPKNALTPQLVVTLLSLILLAPLAEAAPITIPFKTFLSQYLKNSSETLTAQRQLSQAQARREQSADQWKSRLEIAPELSFEQQNFNDARPNNSNRTSNLSGRFTQQMPSGTNLEVSGQKYLETQNPLAQAIDRRYSAKISQDLLKNAFGKSQTAETEKGALDFKVAELEFRQTLINSCETAFSLYSDAYIQQEVVRLLKTQLKDAKKALDISRKLYRDRIINKVDKLTSENDFLNTQIQVEQAIQKLINSKRQIQAFLASRSSLDFQLSPPKDFLNSNPKAWSGETLSEVILKQRLDSQGWAVDKARSDRWTDLQLGVEAGETYGRLALGGPLFNYQEQYLKANISIGLDFINKTEDATLKTAIEQRNALAREQQTLQRTQHSTVASLIAMNTLLSQQLQNSEKQVQLLKEKMDMAFQQMKRAKLDFQNYLLHRNAYLNQEQTYLNLQREQWLNLFKLQKEFAHKNSNLCEVHS